MSIQTLSQITTLDALAELLADPALEDYLSALAERDDSDDEIAALREAVAQARARLAPETACEELVALKQQVVAQVGADPALLRPLLARIDVLRAALPTRVHERLFGRLESRIGQKFAFMNGGTGYSNRARRAGSLFTEFAGQTHIAGARTDRHGNADGTDYDLGRDGAFSGHTVHVLNLCARECKMSRPFAALIRKGFAVIERTAPGSAESLSDWLADATQLWVISDSRGHLSDEHVAVIEALWRRGGALYIWGDNQPYYVDANKITAALFDDPKLIQTGNTMGDRIVGEFDGRVGFLPHLVTTGLVNLFEGITIATIDEPAARRHGFTPLLYGSAGNLVTVVRDATDGCGAFMIDTGFTRLYYKWDDAGSARYVCNAGCFLGASGLIGAVEVAPDEAEPALDDLPFVPDGAFQGTCDLSGQSTRTWMVLSVSAKGDALRNTSDFVLTDPLCAAAGNDVFADVLYTETMGQWILSGLRQDPITGQEVVACLPLVDLSHGKNLRGFTDILCAVLMDGKLLPGQARMVFFAVVESMLSRADLKHRDAWEYLYDQCLRGFYSTPDFTAVGRKVPLIDAMTELFSPATDERLQVRRSLASVGVIGRTLLRAGRARPDVVRDIARRAVIGAVIQDAIAAEKKTPGRVPLTLSGLLYDNFHGIPRLNGGRILASRPDFVRDLDADLGGLVELCGGGTLLDRAGLTTILHAMLPHDLRQFSAEGLTQTLLATDEAFLSVYCGTDTGDVVARLNQRFAAYAEGIDWSDPHCATAPPFATTWGPSVFRCVCGERLGDPSVPLDDAALADLRRARVAHFRAVYRVAAPGETWYPGDGTLHYNLHRAVQVVLSEQFPRATRLSASMMPAVAAYLLRDGKGFIYDPMLEQSMTTALESYLSLRRAGQADPKGLLTLEDKARHEQQQLLSSCRTAPRSRSILPDGLLGDL
jgi:hypothetical protein